MKTIVLAAGYATRLYPLTEHFPKPLLEIGGSTILDRMLDDLDAVPEIDGHIVVTNRKFAGIFEDWAKARAEGADPSSLRFAHPSHGASRVGPTRSRSHGRLRAPGSAPSACKPIAILDDGTESNETRLGAVRDLILALERFGIDEDILVAAGDNVLDFSLLGFVEAFRQKGTSMLMCYHEPEVNKLQRTGVLELDAQMKVLRMEEKAQVPASHWAVPPFYIYRKEDLPLVRTALENGCGFDAPGNLACWLAGRTTLHAWPMPAARFDIGSLDSYETAKKRYSKPNDYEKQRRNDSLLRS